MAIQGNQKRKLTSVCQVWTLQVVRRRKLSGHPICNQRFEAELWSRDYEDTGRYVVVLGGESVILWGKAETQLISTTESDILDFE